jgi:branched-chain amino acid transport system substrate-binding protein
MSARPALLSALFAAVGAAFFGGCDGGDDEATGGTRTIYVSVPLHGESAQEGRANVNGAKLALADSGGEAGGIDVEAIYVDDTSGEGRRARWDPVIVADNARRAAQDSSAIAYIGELESGATRTSLPITNEAMMLHVSPGSTAVDLVEEAPGSDDVPELTQPTGERTFGRVIPDDEVQAAAGAKWARALGYERVAADSRGGEFGKTVTEEFLEEAEALGLSVARRGELTYIGGEPEEVVVPLERYLPEEDLMFTDAFLSPFVRYSALEGDRITSAAQDPEQLPPAGQEFVRGYEREFGERPDRYAAYGYEAMAVVLDSIERAAEPDDRSDVIDAFFATEDRESVLGTYSIDELGNTTLDAISGYRVEDGRPVFESALRAP